MTMTSANSRDLALGAYYFATLPVRIGTRWITSCRGEAPIHVLFYHRVADIVPNAWTISTREFARQIQWLRANFEMISLHEAQRRLIARENRRPAVCITFDDGYADNCDFAIPLLVEQKVPTTYFVALDIIKYGRTFPHDELAGIPLPVNSLQQLRDMANDGIDLGLHTRTHCDLGKLHHPECLHDEIVSARTEMRSLLGVPVDFFAFPYGQHGNMSAAAVRMIHHAGFRGFCSAYGGYNWPGDDSFHLQRIHGDPEFIRLKNWLTIDPRKARVKRFSVALTGGSEHHA